jgi:DNA-binding PadR family transcriptional regulator
MAAGLTAFSYVILVLVGRDGAAPHDLIQMMRRGSAIYWSAAPSQFYAEPKRLASLGYLEAERRPGKTHPRTHYSLTARGRRAVSEWLAEPAGFIRIQNEPAVRLLGADLAPSVGSVVHSLDALRAELDETDAQLDAAEALGATIPHRERQLRLNHRLSRRIVAAFRDWLDEVDAELGA